MPPKHLSGSWENGCGGNGDGRPVYLPGEKATAVVTQADGSVRTRPYPTSFPGQQEGPAAALPNVRMRTGDREARLHPERRAGVELGLRQCSSRAGAHRLPSVSFIQDTLAEAEPES